jgi:hypothetical protein
MCRKLFLFATLATLATLPSVAAAQRGGSRTQADKPVDMFSKEDEQAMRPTLRLGDLEDQSPLKLLLDKHKDLKLTDAQVADLKTKESALKDKSAPTLKLADSLINQLHSTSSSDDARAKARLTALALGHVIESLRTTYDSAGTDAVAALDAEQQSKAKELLDKQKADGTKMLQKKMSGGQPRGI